MTHELDQTSLGEALRRHKFLVVLSVLFVTAVMGAYAFTRPATYDSTVQVLVRPTLGNPYSPDTGASGQQVTIAMSTEAAVVDSGPVAEIANRQLDSPWTPGSGVVHATVPPNTQVVQITFTAGTADAARKGAAVTADAYLKYRHEQTSTTQRARLETLRRQVGAVSQSLQRATEKAQQKHGGADNAQQVQLYANQLVTLETTINSVEAAGADPGSVIAPAPLPDSPAGIDPRLVTGVGVLVGLAVAVMLALWRERSHRRVRSDSDLAVDGVPILARPGSVPAVGQAGALGRRPAHEVNYARLRTAVLAKLSVGSSVALSGISKDIESDGPSLELGRSLQRAGYRTCVLLLASGHGASGRSLGDFQATDSADAVLAPAPEVNAGGLDVRRLSCAGEDLAELASTLRFTALASALVEDHDYVVIAAPPADSAAGLAVVRNADATLLLAHDRSTSVGQVRELLSRAGQLGVAVIGMVLTERHRRRGRNDLGTGHRGDRVDQAGSVDEVDAAARLGT